MRTLAIFENEKNNGTLTVSIEANAIMYVFTDGENVHYEIVESPFSEDTIVALLSVIDDSKAKFNFCIGDKEIFAKGKNRYKELEYSVGNHSYTSMKLLP